MGGKAASMTLSVLRMNSFASLFVTVICLLAPSLTRAVDPPGDYINRRLASLAPDKVIVYKKIADRELELRLFLPDGWKAADRRPCFHIIDTSKDGYGNEKIGERWQELSPVHHVRPGLPPTLTFHGTGDTVTPFAGAKAFHEAMLAAGNRSELDVNEGGAHGYLMREESLYEDTLNKSFDFLQSLNLLHPDKP